MFEFSQWWPWFGRWSVVAGFAIGALVAALLTWQRMSARKKGRASPQRLLVLWLADTVNMGAFFALLFALHEMYKSGVISSSLRWFLLALTVLSIGASVALGHFGKDRWAPVEPDEEAKPAPPTAKTAGNEIGNG